MPVSILHPSSHSILCEDIHHFPTLSVKEFPFNLYVVILMTNSFLTLFLWSFGTCGTVIIPSVHFGAILSLTLLQF